jgi:hypothetical protein
MRLQVREEAAMIHAQLLLDPCGAAGRAVPGEAPGIIPAPDRQPDG